ncbi:MAG: response regulator [bacterium]|nr:response regulator [bacterium]
MKNILMIEDNKDQIMLSREFLESAGFSLEVVEVLPHNVSDPAFQTLVGRVNKFDMIIWDADMSVNGSKLMTFDGHIQEVRKNFKGPMIANSSEQNCREKQLKAGCTHAVERKGIDLLGLAEKLLN